MSNMAVSLIIKCKGQDPVYLGTKLRQGSQIATVIEGYFWKIEDGNDVKNDG